MKIEHVQDSEIAKQFVAIEKKDEDKIQHSVLHWKRRSTLDKGQTFIDFAKKEWPVDNSDKYN